MSSTTLHRARKPHPCGMYPCTDMIEPGALYVRYVAFPGEDGHEDGTRPRVIRVCAGCVDRNGGWVRDHYGVPAHLGGRVRFEGRPGTIVDLRGGQVWIRLDTGGRVVPVHPLWRVEYDAAKAPAGAVAA